MIVPGVDEDVAAVSSDSSTFILVLVAVGVCANALVTLAICLYCRRTKVKATEETVKTEIELQQKQNPAKKNGLEPMMQMRRAKTSNFREFVPATKD